MSSPEELTKHARANRAYWDGVSDSYQAENADFITHDELHWIASEDPFLPESVVEAPGGA